MLEANTRNQLAARIFSWPGLEGAAGLAMLMTAVYAASSSWLGGGQSRWLEWAFPIAGAVFGDLYFGRKAAGRDDRRRRSRASEGER
jgi:hypothetical protein